MDGRQKRDNKVQRHLIRIRTLGEPSVEDGNRNVIDCLVKRPKCFALLTYLALNPERTFHQRDSLLAMFWPGSSSEDSRNCLRQSLHVLRQSLGPDVVISKGRNLIAVEPHLLTSDIADFLGALGTNRLKDALALYRGDFLEGLFVSDAPEFELWVDRHRHSLRGRAAEAVRCLAEEAERSGNHGDARRWWSRLEGLSPFSEEAIRQVIQNHLRLGNQMDAVQTSMRLIRRLAAEADHPLAPETVRLIESVFSKTDEIRGQHKLPGWRGVGQAHSVEPQHARTEDKTPRDSRQ